MVRIHVVVREKKCGLYSLNTPTFCFASLIAAKFSRSSFKIPALPIKSQSTLLPSTQTLVSTTLITSLPTSTAPSSTTSISFFGAMQSALQSVTQNLPGFIRDPAIAIIGQVSREQRGGGQPEMERFWTG